MHNYNSRTAIFTQIIFTIRVYNLFLISVHMYRFVYHPNVKCPNVPSSTKNEISIYIINYSLGYCYLNIPYLGTHYRIKQATMLSNWRNKKLLGFKIRRGASDIHLG